MKYIRTEDGRILNKSKLICSAFNEEYISPNWNDDIEKYLQTKIVAEANTIEELCDCFVGIRKSSHMAFTGRLDGAYWFKETNGWLGRLDSYENIYGAIWTDKGLIYVAKMNDKGELKLL